MKYIYIHSTEEHQEWFQVVTSNVNGVKII